MQYKAFENIYKELFETIPSIQIKDFAIYNHSVWVEVETDHDRIEPQIGLSTVIREPSRYKIENLGEIKNQNLRTIASKYLKTEPIERSIGLAAINAQFNHIENPLLKNKNFEMKHQNAYEMLYEKGADKNIAVIGSFPFTQKMKNDKRFKNFWVFDLNPKDDEFSPERFPDLLPQADITMITGMTFVNQTFHNVIKYCEKSYNIILGASSTMSEVLFDYNVNAVCSSIVTDTKLCKQYMKEGASFKDAQGIQFVTLAKK